MKHLGRVLTGESCDIGIGDGVGFNSLRCVERLIDMDIEEGVLFTDHKERFVVVDVVVHSRPEVHNGARDP